MLLGNGNIFDQITFYVLNSDFSSLNLHLSRNLSILIVVLLYFSQIGTRNRIDKLLVGLGTS